MAGVISKSVKNEQVLDRLQVERERGITVKAQSASLIYKYKDTEYLLNLIDTPVSETLCQYDIFMYCLGLCYLHKR